MHSVELIFDAYPYPDRFHPDHSRHIINLHIVKMQTVKILHGLIGNINIGVDTESVVFDSCQAASFQISENALANVTFGNCWIGTLILPPGALKDDTN